MKNDLKAYVFAGQGIQLREMGYIFEEFPKMVETANQILGYFIQELYHTFDEAKLMRTEYSQPLIYIVNALEYLHEIRINQKEPEFVVGHSLGEINALQAAGMISFEDGLRLVKERGRLMQETLDGAMCAVCGKSFENIVESINRCSNRANFDLANLNSPKQVVISGAKEEIVKAKEELEEAGFRCILLKVSGAFHSRLMQEANQRFEQYIDNIEFFAPNKTKVISSVTAKEYMNPYKDLLKVQMIKPVNWIDSINHIIDEGCYEFKQVGKGNQMIQLIDDIKFQRIVAHRRTNR